MYNTTILQWNCRGIKANYEELLLLLTKYNPKVICLQETFLKDINQLNIKNYYTYNHIHKDGHRASGGVSILVRKDIPQHQITIDSDLQVIAVKATLHKPVNICSIYIPPHDSINETTLTKLIDQIPKPHLLLGDLNSHNTIWGCLKTNKKGRDLEKVINSNNLCILNNKSPTYLNPSTGSYSAIDVSLSDPSSYMDYVWKVHNDPCGSDHFPIILEISQPIHENNRPSCWKTNKANWQEFKTLCNSKLIQNLDNTDLIKHFTETLISIANLTIPKTSPSNSRNTPWFNNECKTAIQLRNAALRKFNKEPSTNNLNSFKLFRAKARRIIKQAKKISWQNYVNRLNSSTKTNTVWKMIKKISGKTQSTPLKHLIKDNIEITNIKDIADTLAETFSTNSSSKNANKQFLNHKTKTEKQKLNFKSENTESFNRLFSLPELTEAIQRSHNTTVGPDEIHSEFLKQLPPKSLDYLLNALNDIWKNSRIPESWKLATIIPIPKPGKNSLHPSNYRPIALTSCLCKTMERMVNKRLVWFLESNNLYTNSQCGFRSQKSTMDHVVRLETSIREANIQKQHLVAIFFDLEKAYETTWKYGIMNDLHNIGLRGRLPYFIQAFLSDRKFQVRIGSTLSDIQNQEEGVPQGSILSVTLFNIKINSITNCLNPGVDSYLYVDDFCITSRSKYMRTAERQLQQCINKINKWAIINGFKISKAKTQCVHFCQLRKMHNNPTLKLDGSEIPVVEQYKFLGIIFDKKLSFIPHLEYLRDKCSKAMKLLRVIAHTDWGADQQTLLKLYRTLIRSKIDYGCYIYGATRKSYLKSLNTVHHEGLRLVLGAFRTSPVESLYSEAYEPPLKLRFTKLGLQYYTKIKSLPTNPAHDCIFNPKQQTLFNQKEKAIKTFGLRMKPILEEADISLTNIHDTVQLSSSPWLLKQPVVILDLSKLTKKNTHPLIYHEKLHNIQEKYPNYSHIYTDGSKDSNRTGCGVAFNNKTMKKCLPKEASIFTAEASAIDIALNIVSTSNSK